MGALFSGKGDYQVLPLLSRSILWRWKCVIIGERKSMTAWGNLSSNLKFCLIYQNFSCYTTSVYH
jgi:hypothetical protein